jgi:phospholipid/cholesterol/gamma-HCH transport system ATP-binding protein
MNFSVAFTGSFNLKSRVVTSLFEVSQLTHAFEVREAVVQFHELTVLNRINLQVKTGECLVLVGPSGQGKTVLLKVLAGLITPQKGEVLIEGHSWNSLRGAKRLQVLKRVGMLFQKNALFDSLTCGENIAFPLRETTGLSERDIDDKVNFFLEAVGIPHAKKLFPDEISGGMQKRLGIARALALDPEIIFYDDPTAGLDPITSRKIVELILNLKKQKGATLVAITNDINRAYQMADRIVMVVDQEIILTGTPEETKRHSDPRVHQFIHGSISGPLTAMG